jgi:CRP-like cAMP-binding protein
MSGRVAPDIFFSQTHRLFDVLSDVQRDEIRRALTVHEMKRGSRIYKPGDLAHHTYWVWSGVVKLGTPAWDDNLLVTCFLFPGDVFGEACAVDDEPRDHLAQVHQDSTVCAIPCEVLRVALETTPAFACRLAALLVARVRACSARIEDLLHRSAHARIAHTLLTLGRPFATGTNHGLVIPLRLSCRDLASLVGVRRETVSLVLADLRRHGVVETLRDRIVVQDPQALTALCGNHSDGRSAARRALPCFGEPAPARRTRRSGVPGRAGSAAHSG